MIPRSDVQNRVVRASKFAVVVFNRSALKRGSTTAMIRGALRAAA